MQGTPALLWVPIAVQNTSTWEQTKMIKLLFFPEWTGVNTSTSQRGFCASEVRVHLIYGIRKTVTASISENQLVQKHPPASGLTSRVSFPS